MCLSALGQRRTSHKGHRGKKQEPPQTLIDNGTIYVTIGMLVDMREYHDRGGHSPFREWYDRLNAEAARKVTTAIYRVGLGNSPMPRVLELGFTNARSILVLAIACILGKKASRS